MTTEKTSMNKAELVAFLRDRYQLATKAEAERIIDCFTGGIIEALPQHGKVTLVGFGTFSIHERQERKGHNPRTGAEMNIPASRTAKFTAGQKLKAACETSTPKSSRK